MKKQLLLLAMILFGFAASASHIVGGDMRYEYLGPGTNLLTKKYKITLRLFRDNHCLNGCAVMPTIVDIGIYNNDNNKEYPGPNPFIIPKTSESIVPVNSAPPCIVNAPDLNYSLGIYELTVDLPDNLKGYTAAYQTCCRVNPLENVIYNNTGSTYFCVISGTGTLGNSFNSSPNFNTDLSIICQNKPFTFDFSAVDQFDSDSLVYSFTSAFDRGDSSNSNPVNPRPPNEFNVVQYTNGFSADLPLGASVSINPKTGIITGIAPNQGKYVVGVRVDEYRKGILIGYGFKDFIINVADCNFAGAQLDPKPATCDGFTVSFTNANNSSLNHSYLWTFGDIKYPGTDTSHDQSPTHVYTDTGIYKFKLVVNQGEACADSATQIVKVFPGFHLGFIASGVCKDLPTQFTDTSKTSYGVINTWRYDFGDNLNPADTSHNRNPSYTYHTAGTYNITFTGTNSKGCISTITQPITIVNNPLVTVQTTDTTYCGTDSIVLSATSNVPVQYSWSPTTNMLNPNTANPTVFPKIVTTYTVSGDAGGCSGTASVTVRPVTDFKTNVSPAAKSICEDDTLSLTATSNYNNVKYLWSPDYNIKYRDSSVAKVYPAHDTTYSVTGTWGNSCTSTSSINIKVKQLAKPDAGPDVAFCNGASGVQLNATGGDDYVWTPSSGLNNSNIPNPFAKPGATTKYFVSVGVTGCSKKRIDSVLITLRPNPPIVKTNDTLICSIDTLQLNASSQTGGTFVWSPNYNIINPNSPNPRVYPKTTTRYIVNLVDTFGCKNVDSVLVNVKNVVTINAGIDTSLCKGDTITLQPISDALHYQWSPASSLDNSTNKYPRAYPLTTTQYIVIANIGKCESRDSVTVTVGPPPTANAGPDKTICFGDTVQLHATGGSIYLWSPPFYISDPHIADPIATPERNIRYQVRVTDTLGCPKPAYDTVFIKVYPKIIADAGPADTSIVVGQPLQLKGSGGVSYLWTPNTGLNNSTISNPVATLSSSITYHLKVSNEIGCAASDTIRVNVYTVIPGLFVPNAFTPNNNGRNDVFTPIAIGIKKLNYFRVYDRWGQLMFATTEINKGWDGTFKGKPQDPAVFVWIVQAIDFNDKSITQKGTVVLIR